MLLGWGVRRLWLNSRAFKTQLDRDRQWFLGPENIEHGHDSHIKIHLTKYGRVYYMLSVPLICCSVFIF